jgi:hypothetical protein
LRKSLPTSMPKPLPILLRKFGLSGCPSIGVHQTHLGPCVEDVSSF